MLLLLQKTDVHKDILQMDLQMHMNKTSRWILRQTDLLRNLDDVCYECPANRLADANGHC